MRRREFITLLGGAAAWPVAARAQQGERVRRIGVLVNLPADDPQAQVRNAAFLEGLQELRWTVDNVRMDLVPSCGDIDSLAPPSACSQARISHWTTVRFCDGCP